MSEQVTLIPSVPPIEESVPKVIEEVAPPKSNLSPDSVLPENSGEVASYDSEAVPEVSTEIQAVSTVVSETLSLSGESNESITSFQGVTYASFILTFCLAGFAAVVVFRKALKASVKRFSIGAKMLSLAYLVIAFNCFFGTYLYSKFLNGGDTLVPLTIPILSWILVGPLVAVVLNSLLTREDAPSAKKILFDAFTYLVIFGCVVASQMPSLGAKEPLVFSFFGAFFFIVPIIRFSTSLKMAKVCHPELQEMFVQILIRSLLFLPVLLPSLVFANVYELTSYELTILLFNLVTFAFVLLTGLLMVISIDYITQGISADQLVAKKTDPPITTPDLQPDIPSAPSNAPTAPVSPSSPVTPSVLEPQQSVSEESVEPKSPTAPAAPVASSPSSSAEKPLEPSTPFEESSETLEFDVEKHGSTVIKFNVPQFSTDESQTADSESSKSKRSKVRSLDSKSKLEKNIKSSQLPKPPQSPDASKSSDSKPRLKPPEKPKKRF
ncbi:MAG: hypothetical protein ACJAT5_000152 [Lentimonas sp.]|jgi:hypothetical protein